MSSGSLGQWVLAAALVWSGMTAVAQQGNELTGMKTQAIVTVEPKGGGEAAGPVPVSSVQAKIAGKPAKIESWHGFQQDKTQLQLVLLIDNSARSSLGLHFKEIQKFLRDQAPSTEVAVGYMQNGSAQLTQPLTTNHDAVAASVRLPSGVAGSSGSPYFVLSDLIKRWPSQEKGVRREVVMISDGIDRYYGLRFNPDNPYVNRAINDAIRGNVVIYSIYYRDTGLASRSNMGTDGGQNYLIQVSGATGGQAFYLGLSNPVDMTPFFSDITRKLENQYELTLTPPEGKRGVQSFKVQVSAPNTKTQAPERIFVQ